MEFAASEFHLLTATCVARAGEPIGHLVAPSDGEQFGQLPAA
jgi:hypothetical protein